MKNFSSRKLFKVLLVVAAFALLAYFNPKNFFDPFRFFLEKASYPFKKISYSFSQKSRAWTEFVFLIGSIKNENTNLRKENLELSSENARLHDIERENGFLREQLEILPRGRFDLQPAWIISQDPQGLGGNLEIDKGSDQGIREGMPVIVSKGIIIGKIEKVFTDKSVVMLLTNPKSVLNVSIAQSGAKGLVRGEYGLGIVVDSILQTESVSVGNEVVTSGSSSEMPKGLLVGYVQDIRPSPDHLFNQAVAESPVKVSVLEAVFVIKGEK